jgi:hypothetical protein
MDNINYPVSSIEYVDDAIPKIKANLVNPIILKNLLQPTDIIYFYTDDAAYLPEISNVTITPSTTHNDVIILNASVQYNYDVKIRFRVVAGNGAIVANWSAYQDPFLPITGNLTTSLLSIGLNNLTIEVETQDVKTNSLLIPNAVTIIDNYPQLAIINLDSDNFKVHATITDADAGDTVQYRLTMINNRVISKIVVPWTTLSAPPSDISYEWDSGDIEVNTNNTLRIECRDNLGGVTTYDYVFTGEYKNMMFTLPNGNFYSTDKGVELSLLDFGTLLAGNTTDIVEIFIRNNNPGPVSNIEITSQLGNGITDQYIEFSKTEVPFVPETVLSFGQLVMNKYDTTSFYMRVRTESYADGVNYFKLFVNFVSI